MYRLPVYACLADAIGGISQWRVLGNPPHAARASPCSPPPSGPNPGPTRGPQPSPPPATPRSPAPPTRGYQPVSAKGTSFDLMQMAFAIHVSACNAKAIWYPPPACLEARHDPVAHALGAPELAVGQAAPGVAAAQVQRAHQQGAANRLRAGGQGEGRAHAGAQKAYGGRGGCGRGREGEAWVWGWDWVGVGGCWHVRQQQGYFGVVGCGSSMQGGCRVPTRQGAGPGTCDSQVTHSVRGVPAGLALHCTAPAPRCTQCVCAST